MIAPLAVREALSRGWALEPPASLILALYEEGATSTRVDVVDQVMGFGGLEERALAWLNTEHAQPGQRWLYWEGDLILQDTPHDFSQCACENPLHAPCWCHTTERGSSMTQHIFRANVVMRDGSDKDEALATALSVVSDDYEIVRFRADKVGGGVVQVIVTFKTSEVHEAVVAARLMAEALQHRYPTEATIDGRTPKYVKRETDTLDGKSVTDPPVAVHSDDVPGYQVIKARDLKDTHVLADVFGRPKPIRSVKTVQRKGSLQPVVQVTFADGQREPFLADSNVTVIQQEA